MHIALVYFWRMRKAEAVDPVLVRTYNQPLPRYTSYPTVPFWNDALDGEEWARLFTQRFAEENHTTGISLYVHLPFCESLCTYCGCNKKITTNHSVEEEYLNAIETEWRLYRQLMPETPIIRELHLGGGTPTFFSPQNLMRLVQTILTTAQVHPEHQFSIEGYPNNTTAEHLQVLYDLSFRRISYGVQDNDPAVQRIINRIQPVENVRRATEAARRIGFTSVNYDLIYGLPLQTRESIERTINEVIALQPDRIAFYSYAHVPWTSKAQRLFDEADLPDADTKISLYLKGKELLTAAGYADIGMDHFALPHDELYRAREAGNLHRNFMGYTTQHAGLLLGLGVSAISDTGTAFAQNEKTLHDYNKAVQSGALAVRKGYVLSDEDGVFKKYILDISCQGSTAFRKQDLPLLQQYTFPKLETLAADCLVEWTTMGMQLTAQGHYFIRVVCSALDLYLQRGKQQEKPVFSKSI
jgi:oxygen-independent coproporphyrinogen-3 oxidase